MAATRHLKYNHSVLRDFPAFPTVSPAMSNLQGNSSDPQDPLALLNGASLDTTFGALLVGNFFGLMCVVVFINAGLET